MKRVLWMILILSFLFSLTCLFAQEKASVNNSTEEQKLQIEKIGKKVADVRKVTVRSKPKTSIKQMQNLATPQNTSKSVQQSSKVVKSAKNAVKKANRKPYVKRKNVVNSKTIKSKTLEMKKTN